MHPDVWMPSDWLPPSIEPWVAEFGTGTLFIIAHAYEEFTTRAFTIHTISQYVVYVDQNSLVLAYKSTTSSSSCMKHALPSPCLQVTRRCNQTMPQQAARGCSTSSRIRRSASTSSKRTRCSASRQDTERESAPRAAPTQAEPTQAPPSAPREHRHGDQPHHRRHTP